MKVQILTDYLYILPAIIPFFLWFIFLFICLSFPSFFIIWRGRCCPSSVTNTWSHSDTHRGSTIILGIPTARCCQIFCFFVEFNISVVHVFLFNSFMFASPSQAFKIITFNFKEVPPVWQFYFIFNLFCVYVIIWLFKRYDVRLIVMCIIIPRFNKIKDL